MSQLCKIMTLITSNFLVTDENKTRTKIIFGIRWHRRESHVDFAVLDTFVVSQAMRYVILLYCMSMRVIVCLVGCVVRMRLWHSSYR